MDWYKAFIKPSCDFVLATILLIALSPIIIAIFIINWLVFGNPLFIQTRIGRGEKPFQLIKFKSMRVAGDESSIPLWGKILRLTSLDELPQLILIIRGQMSFVGPRPLLPEYLYYYSEDQRQRHLVKPGITGLAQVSGRNRLSWDESLRLDVEYANRCSFGLDLKIVFRTIPQILNFSHVNQSKIQSREPFNQQTQ